MGTPFAKPDAVSVKVAGRGGAASEVENGDCGANAVTCTAAVLVVASAARIFAVALQMKSFGDALSFNAQTVNTPDEPGAIDWLVLVAVQATLPAKILIAGAACVGERASAATVATRKESLFIEVNSTIEIGLGQAPALSHAG